MTLFALLLGFVLGAAFYVLADRGSALGDLDLPRRLGMMVVVGLVLALVAMVFGKDDDGPRPAVATGPAATEQAAAPAATAAAGAEATTSAAAEPAAETAPPPLADAPAQATAAAEAATDPGAEAPAEPEAEAAIEPSAQPVAEAAPAPAAAAPIEAAPEQPELQCVYSVDSDRCVCFDRSGAPAQVEPEQCREIAAGDGG